jgi:acylphosphatase
MKEAEIVVTGKVQGIGFREFSKIKAEELGLTGYAENQEDGSLYILVQGDKDSIAIFVDHIRKGPMFATITDVALSFHDKPQDTFAEFEIW